MSYKKSDCKCENCNCKKDESLTEEDVEPFDSTEISKGKYIEYETNQES